MNFSYQIEARKVEVSAIDEEDGYGIRVQTIDPDLGTVTISAMYDNAEVRNERLEALAANEDNIQLHFALALDELIGMNDDL